MSSLRSSGSNSKEVQLSKGLTWLLRHAAPQENVTVLPGGYVPVKVVLNHRRFKKYSVEDIQTIVSGSDKQRFALRNDPVTGELQIRANQGHSFPVEEHGLRPIKDPNEFPTVIHGTYIKNWESILKSGLKRMNRVHIHFARGELGDKSVISGLRQSAEVYIYVNLKKALEDGLEFYVSENNVILSPGNSEGVLETKYFLKVVNVKTGTELLYLRE